MDNLENLDLASTMKPEDIELLSQLLGKSQNLGKGKKNKDKSLTTQQRNALLAQLSSHKTINENKKTMSDMSESEKKEYRTELRNRLHQKQNMLKQQRTSKHILQKNLDSTIKKTTDSAAEQTAESATELATELATEQSNTNDQLNDFIN